MSSDSNGEPAVISIRGLGKSYRIDHVAQKRHGTLGEVLADPRPRRPARRRARAGDVLGGARFGPGHPPAARSSGSSAETARGKSTLLKLLSRITRPSEGGFEVRGRVGSLLEVGTGFHPELTGRENVYLNGSILGMTRPEIRSKFDEIVDFAGVEKFLDTPVKRYSSGMYVRLAFAVAAHLEPEVLIVDEVLAVGDTQFQQKCLGKMQDVSAGGRTVLFVSHNVGTVQQLCSRAVLLRGGRLVLDGTPGEVTQHYLDELEAGGSVEADVADRPGTGDVEITAARLIDAAGRPAAAAIVGGQDALVQLDYVNHAACGTPSSSPTCTTTAPRSSQASTPP